MNTTLADWNSPSVSLRLLLMIDAKRIDDVIGELLVSYLITGHSRYPDNYMYICEVIIVFYVYTTTTSATTISNTIYYYPY